MNRKRLAKIEQELSALQANPRDKAPRLFVRLAKKLGRRLATRGKEPTYVSPAVPDLGLPISIPNHRVLKIGTALSILVSLQSDLDEWKLYLDQTDQPEGLAEDEDEDDDSDLSDDV